MVRSHFWRRVFRICFPLLVFLWILLVLYPNPLNLVTSVRRIADSDIDPVAVASLSKQVPDDPAAIERAVDQQIPYSYDWETYGMPWYFPSVEEVLQKGKGDCKGRTLVLASVFEAKDIPYTLNLSPIHMWVKYEEKEATKLENPGVKFYQQDPETGERSLQVPNIPVGDIMDSFQRGFWEPMPGLRKALLLCGLTALIGLRLRWSRRGKEIQKGTQ